MTSLPPETETFRPPEDMVTLPPPASLSWKTEPRALSRTVADASRYLPLVTSLSLIPSPSPSPLGSAVTARPVIGASAEARTVPERSADRYGRAAARSVNVPSGTTGPPSAALIAR